MSGMLKLELKALVFLLKDIGKRIFFENCCPTFIRVGARRKDHLSR